MAEPREVDVAPEPEPVTPLDTWVAAPREAEAAPETRPEPILETIPAQDIAPEPLGAADPPAAARAAVDPRDLGRAVADLAPLLDGLLPLTRVSDRAGVTPRLLVLMRTLADTPLGVTEQATALGVSRPVVADLTASSRWAWPGASAARLTVAASMSCSPTAAGASARRPRSLPIPLAPPPPHPPTTHNTPTNTLTTPHTRRQPPSHHTDE